MRSQNVDSFCRLGSGYRFFFFPTVNCVDRHMKADPDRCALIWEKDEPEDVERVTYR